VGATAQISRQMVQAGVAGTPDPVVSEKPRGSEKSLPGIPQALCETCLERGRERQADVVRPGIRMCRDCYSGKPFDSGEEVGGVSESYRLRQGARSELERRREYGRRYRARNLAKVQEANRRYQRERYARLRGSRTDKQMSMAFLQRSSEL